MKEADRDAYPFPPRALLRRVLVGSELRCATFAGRKRDHLFSPSPVTGELRPLEDGQSARERGSMCQSGLETRGTCPVCSREEYTTPVPACVPYYMDVPGKVVVQCLVLFLFLFFIFLKHAALTATDVAARYACMTP